MEPTDSRDEFDRLFLSSDVPPPTPDVHVCPECGKTVGWCEHTNPNAPAKEAAKVPPQYVHGPGSFERYRRRSRTTGAIVSIYDTHHPRSDLDPASGRWATVCWGKPGEAHNGVANHDSYRVARQWAAHPEEWCEECMGNVSYQDSPEHEASIGDGLPAWEQLVIGLGVGTGIGLGDSAVNAVTLKKRQWEHGQGKHGWPLADCPSCYPDGVSEGLGLKKPKVAALTRNQMLKKRDELSKEYGGDKTEVLYAHPSGWTIHKHLTVGSTGLEGALMGHCWEGAGNKNNSWSRDKTNLDPNNLGNHHEWHLSVRDPDNLPHASFFHSPPPNDDWGKDRDKGISYMAYGQHNAYLKKRDSQIIDAWHRTLPYDIIPQDSVAHNLDHLGEGNFKSFCTRCEWENPLGSHYEGEQVLKSHRRGDHKGQKVDSCYLCGFRGDERLASLFGECQSCGGTGYGLNKAFRYQEAICGNCAGAGLLPHIDYPRSHEQMEYHIIQHHSISQEAYAGLRSLEGVHLLSHDIDSSLSHVHAFKSTGRERLASGLGPGLATCPECNATPGNVGSNPCPRCAGSGLVPDLSMVHTCAACDKPWWYIFSDAINLYVRRHEGETVSAPTGWSGQNHRPVDEHEIIRAVESHVGEDDAAHHMKDLGQMDLGDPENTPENLSALEQKLRREPRDETNYAFAGYGADLDEMGRGYEESDPGMYMHREHMNAAPLNVLIDHFHRHGWEANSQGPYWDSWQGYKGENEGESGSKLHIDQPDAQWVRDWDSEMRRQHEADHMTHERYPSEPPFQHHAHVGDDLGFHHEEFEQRLGPTDSEAIIKGTPMDSTLPGHRVPKPGDMVRMKGEDWFNGDVGQPFGLAEVQSVSPHEFSWNWSGDDQEHVSPHSAIHSFDDDDKEFCDECGANYGYCTHTDWATPHDKRGHVGEDDGKHHVAELEEEMVGPRGTGETGLYTGKPGELGGPPVGSCYAQSGMFVCGLHRNHSGRHSFDSEVYKRQSHVGDDAALHHSNEKQVREQHPYGDDCVTCHGVGLGVDAKPCADCRGVGVAYDDAYWDTDEQLHDFPSYPAFQQMKVDPHKLTMHLEEHGATKDHENPWTQHAYTHGRLQLDPETVGVIFDKAKEQKAAKLGMALTPEEALPQNLQDTINEFRKLPNVHRLEEPDVAHMRCGPASRDFGDFAAARGHKVELRNLRQEPWNPGWARNHQTEHDNYEGSCHMVAYVDGYHVDWTARQYDPKSPVPRVYRSLAQGDAIAPPKAEYESGEPFSRFYREKVEFKSPEESRDPAGWTYDLMQFRPGTPEWDPKWMNPPDNPCKEHGGKDRGNCFETPLGHVSASECRCGEERIAPCSVCKGTGKVWNQRGPFGTPRHERWQEPCWYCDETGGQALSYRPVWDPNPECPAHGGEDKTRAWFNQQKTGHYGDDMGRHHFPPDVPTKEWHNPCSRCNGDCIDPESTNGQWCGRCGGTGYEPTDKGPRQSRRAQVDPFIDGEDYEDYTGRTGTQACDYGHFSPDVRRLPTGEHSAVMVCKDHYAAEAEFRQHNHVENPTADWSIEPWEELEKSEDDEPYIPTLAEHDDWHASGAKGKACGGPGVEEMRRGVDQRGMYCHVGSGVVPYEHAILRGTPSYGAVWHCPVHAGCPEEGPVIPQTKQASHTRTKYLKRRDVLLAKHPDTTKILATDPEGWTVRKLHTVGDAAYEGEMMGNCIKEIKDGPCDRCGGSGNCPECAGDGRMTGPDGSWPGPKCTACRPWADNDLPHSGLNTDKQGTGECSECKGTGSEQLHDSTRLNEPEVNDTYQSYVNERPESILYSLRDPDNIPAVSFVMYKEEPGRAIRGEPRREQQPGWRLADALGRYNEDPQPEHVEKLVNFYKGFTKRKPGVHLMSIGGPVGPGSWTPDEVLHEYVHIGPKAEEGLTKLRAPDSNCEACKLDQHYLQQRTAQSWDTADSYGRNADNDVPPSNRGQKGPYDPWKDVGDSGELTTPSPKGKDVKKWVQKRPTFPGDKPFADHPTNQDTMNLEQVVGHEASEPHVHDNEQFGRTYTPEEYNALPCGHNDEELLASPDPSLRGVQCHECGAICLPQKRGALNRPKAPDTVGQPIPVMKVVHKDKANSTEEAAAGVVDRLVGVGWTDLNVGDTGKNEVGHWVVNVTGFPPKREKAAALGWGWIGEFQVDSNEDELTKIVREAASSPLVNPNSEQAFSQDPDLNDTIARRAKGARMQPQEFTAAEGKHVRGLLKGSKVYVHMGGNAMLGFLKSGSFKTFHQTGKTTGGGDYTSADRLKAEKYFFQGASKKDAPIYGALHAEPNLGYGHVLGHYGMFALELKSHVKQRTTFTFGDSLDRTLVPYRKMVEVACSHCAGGKQESGTYYQLPGSKGRRFQNDNGMDWDQLKDAGICWGCGGVGKVGKERWATDIHPTVFPQPMVGAKNPHLAFPYQEKEHSRYEEQVSGGREPKGARYLASVDDNEGTFYTEAQIHGGITLSDVAKIHHFSVDQYNGSVWNGYESDTDHPVKGRDFDSWGTQRQPVFPCPACGSTGGEWSSRCSRCSGHGVHTIMPFDLIPGQAKEHGIGFEHHWFPQAKEWNTRYRKRYDRKVQAAKEHIAGRFVVLWPESQGMNENYITVHREGCQAAERERNSRGGTLAPFDHDDPKTVASCVLDEVDPQLRDQGFMEEHIKVHDCVRRGLAPRKELAPGICPGTGQAFDPFNPRARPFYLPCPVCGKKVGTGRSVVPRHKSRNAKVAEFTPGGPSNDWEMDSKPLPVQQPRMHADPWKDLGDNGEVLKPPKGKPKKVEKEAQSSRPKRLTPEETAAWDTEDLSRLDAVTDMTGKLSDDCYLGNHSVCKEKGCGCEHHNVTRLYSGACAAGDCSSCRMEACPDACHIYGGSNAFGYRVGQVEKCVCQTIQAVKEDGAYHDHGWTDWQDITDHLHDSIEDGGHGVMQCHLSYRAMNDFHRIGHGHDPTNAICPQCAGSGLMVEPKRRGLALPGPRWVSRKRWQATFNPGSGSSWDPVRDVQPSSESPAAPSAQGSGGDPWVDLGDNGIAPPRPGYLKDKKLKKWIDDEQMTYPEFGPTFPGVSDINKVGESQVEQRPLAEQTKRALDAYTSDDVLVYDANHHCGDCFKEDVKSGYITHEFDPNLGNCRHCSGKGSRPSSVRYPEYTPCEHCAGSGLEYKESPDSRFIDSEGNEVHESRGDDEWYNTEGGCDSLSCNDCGKVLDTVHDEGICNADWGAKEHKFHFDVPTMPKVFGPHELRHHLDSLHEGDFSDHPDLHGAHESEHRDVHALDTRGLGDIWWDMPEHPQDKRTWLDESMAHQHEGPVVQIPGQEQLKLAGDPGIPPQEPGQWQADNGIDDPTKESISGQKTKRILPKYQEGFPSANEDLNVSIDNQTKTGQQQRVQDLAEHVVRTHGFPPEVVGEEEEIDPNELDELHIDHHEEGFNNHNPEVIRVATQEEN